jgi:hypothetical protein
MSHAPNLDGRFGGRVIDDFPDAAVLGEDLLGCPVSHPHKVVLAELYTGEPVRDTTVGMLDLSFCSSILTRTPQHLEGLGRTLVSTILAYVVVGEVEW